MKRLLVVISVFWGTLSADEPPISLNEKTYEGRKDDLELFYVEGVYYAVGGGIQSKAFSLYVEYGGRKKEVRFFLYLPFTSNLVADGYGRRIGKVSCADMDNGLKECIFNLNSGVKLVITTDTDGLPTISGTVAKGGETISWKGIKLAFVAESNYGL